MAWAAARPEQAAYTVGNAFGHRQRSVARAAKESRLLQLSYLLEDRPGSEAVLGV